LVVRAGSVLPADSTTSSRPWKSGTCRTREVGIATFLLHRDFRDYYNRHGGTLSATGFVGNHLDATVSWTDEQWATPGTRDPFSLFRNGQDWRVNPLLDAGRFHLVRVGARYDTRNDNLDPWSGWFVTADYEYGVGKITDYGPTSPGDSRHQSNGEKQLRSVVVRRAPVQQALGRRTVEPEAARWRLVERRRLASAAPVRVR
jgi:hypothetical protein